MKFLKKIISISLIILLTYNSTSSIFASFENQKDKITKEIIISKQELTKIPGGYKYSKKIDKIINTVKKDQKKLEKLKIKIDELEKKFKNGNKNDKTKRILAILKYIDLKTELELYKIYEKESLENLSKAELRLKEIKTSKISKNETIEIEEKILEMQLSMYEDLNKKINLVKKEAKEILDYEEKGRLNMNLDIGHELIGEVKANLELNEYVGQTSGINNRFYSDIKAILETNIKGEEEQSFELESFIDFITKDGNIYLLLKELNIKGKYEDEKIKEGINFIKNLSEKNKYIKIENNQTEQTIKILESINPNILEYKKVLSKPLFEAYKKEDNKYYLKPTKHACDTIKEISEKFDPLNGKKCSESQYNDMLEELAKNVELYLEIGEITNEMGFETYPKFDIRKFESKIIFTDNSIKEIKSEMVLEGNEGMSINYVYDSNLDFNIKAEGTEINFESKINNNKFKEIKGTVDIEGEINNFSGEINLKNRLISGFFSYENEKYSGYDYEKNKSIYKPGNKITGTISGKQDSKDSIQDIKIDISGKELISDKKFLSAKFIKDSNNYNAEIKTSNNEVELVDMKLELKNKKISGKTIIFDGSGKELVNILHSGKYEKDYLDFNNKINISQGKGIEYLLTGIKNSKEKDNANINLKIDIRGNKNNMNTYIDYNKGDEKVAEINLDNTGTIEYKEIEIKKPSEYIELNEVIETYSY